MLNYNYLHFYAGKGICRLAFYLYISYNFSPYLPPKNCFAILSPPEGGASRKGEFMPPLTKVGKYGIIYYVMGI